MEKQRIKIIFFVIIYSFFFHRWFKFLESDEFKKIFHYHPRIYIKPFRTYIPIKWNKDRKIKVILDSYRFIEKNKHILEDILINEQGINIAKISLSQEYDAFINVGYSERFRKEGEFVLSLECDYLGGKVASVAFALEEKEKGKWTCIVSCVQGYNYDDVPDVFKKTQNLLYKMRPTALVIYALQDFIRELGCQDIYCVGDKIHTYRQKHAIHLQWFHKIGFDYDKFWLEVGCMQIDKDWFLLPLNPARKDISDIKSKKRSLYRKRYAMLDDISLNIFNKIK
jgi:uncharacterized protein VirK/YbjX